MAFDQEDTLKFMVDKETRETPKNMTITVSYKFGESKWTMDELSQPFEFDLKMYGSKMDFDNDFLIRLEFKDDFGEKHTLDKTFNVKLVNTNIPQTIQIYVSRFAFWLDRVYRKIF